MTKIEQMYAAAASQSYLDLDRVQQTTAMDNKVPMSTMTLSKDENVSELKEIEYNEYEHESQHEPDITIKIDTSAHS
jgi:hypothetical protein